LTAELFSNQLSPCGPTITPEIIKPIIPGTLIGLNKMGERSIMNKTRENMRTGLVNGAWNASMMCSNTLLFIKMVLESIYFSKK
jgi:hypothetical protein